MSSSKYHTILLQYLIMNQLTLHDWVTLSYLIYLIVLSIITFFMYRGDKKKAKKGKYRTKEKTLLFLSILGGAYGGLIAMIKYHHKTKREHWYFSFVNILGILIHTTLLIVLFFVIKF